VLVKLLQKNRDIFEWKPADMLGVPRELIEHELHLDPKAKPVKQRLHHFTQDKKDVIKREIARLLDARFIKEVYHPDQLPIQFLYLKRINIGGCVSIILILISHRKKIPSGYPGSIKLWTTQSVAAFYVFSTATWGIIRFPSR
jgi:hypothetical protein